MKNVHSENIKKMMKKYNLTLFIFLSCFFISNFWCNQSAFAQSVKSSPYPTKSIRWVIPFPPGGATDTLGRFLAFKLSETWGQTVIVENRSGVSGTIGSHAVAKSTPDGSIFVVGTTSSHAVSPALIPNMPYDNLRDFSPVALIASFPNVLIANPNGPKTLVDLISQLKSNPSKLSYGSSGNGSSTHLTAELFQQITGTVMVHVPYKGTGPLLNDLVAGHILLGVDQITPVLPFMQSGKLRALGVASLERSSVLPDVPSISEIVPGFEAIGWMGLLGPAGLPPEIVSKVNLDIRQVLMTAEVQQKFRDLGATPGTINSQAFVEFIRKDTEKWRALVKSANIKAD